MHQALKLLNMVWWTIVFGPVCPCVCHAYRYAHLLLGAAFQGVDPLAHASSRSKIGTCSSRVDDAKVVADISDPPSYFFYSYLRGSIAIHTKSLIGPCCAQGICITNFCCCSFLYTVLFLDSHLDFDKYVTHHP